jgi:hypothetical protein
MFLSSRLTNFEPRWDTGEKEILGIVKALAECRWLLAPSPFPVVLYCEHPNLPKTFSYDNDNKKKNCNLVGEPRGALTHGLTQAQHVLEPAKREPW